MSSTGEQKAAGAKGFPAYPEYKDSGIEWLGEVPAHWVVRRLKHVLTLVTDRAANRANPIALENIEGWSGRYIKKESDYSGDGVAFQKGDVLFGKLRPYLAKVYLAGGYGEAVGDFHVMRPSQNMSGRFSLYQFLQSQFISAVDGATYGAKMPRVGWETMGNMPYVTPPEHEQAQVAAFLDHETTRIDALIAEQQRLIALLKEKRQAVISHAVTKGLDPDVPMKDSGVEWLGDVPAHWEVLPLKFIVSTPVTDGPHETPEFADDGVPFISAEAISSGRIDFDKAKFISREDHARFSRKYSPSKYDIYMVKSGATTGVAAIVEDNREFNIWSPLAVIRCKDGVSPYFVFHYIRSANFQESVVLNWNYGTQQNIGMGVVENLPISIPPENEQKEISAFLSSHVENWKILTQEASRTVSLLQERRSALISAAVTGKIDVRGWQADRQAEPEDVLMAAEPRATYQ